MLLFLPFFGALLSKMLSSLLTIYPPLFYTMIPHMDACMVFFMAFLLYVFSVVFIPLLHTTLNLIRVCSGVFLGLKSDTKGYIFLNLYNHKIDVSRNVIFYESHFPYQHTSLSTTDNTSFSFLVPPKLLQ